MKKNNATLQKALLTVLLITGFGKLIAQQTTTDFLYKQSHEVQNVLGKTTDTKQSALQKLRITDPGQSSSEVKTMLTNWNLMDSETTTVPAEDLQTNSAAAYGDTNFLVVWQDNRAGDFYNFDNDIYATRISADGVVLDTQGIRISANPGINEKDPSVAFDGTNFLVVWSDDRHIQEDYDVYGTLVSPNGEILNTNNIQICTEQNPQVFNDISFNGTHYLATWSDYRNGGWDIYGARIDTNGTVIDVNSIPIITAPDTQAYPTVASNETDWLVSWGALGETIIRGVRVAADGSILDPGGFIISSDNGDRIWPDVVYDGTNYMLVWMDRRSGTSVYHWSVYGARVNGNGVVLDPSGIPIAADDTVYEGIPELCFNGTNHLVVWKDDGFSEMTGAIVSTDGIIQSPGQFPISGGYGYELYHAVTTDGSNWLVSWDDGQGTQSVPPGFGSDIFGARVDASGNVLDAHPNDIPISTSSNWQYYSSAAFNGSEYMLLWQEKVAVDQYDIKGTRVDATGNPINSPCLTICDYEDDQTIPAIAFGNTTYLATWKDYRDGPFGSIYAARMSQDGTVLDPNGFEITNSTYGNKILTIAFDGTNFFVVWLDYNSGYHLKGARITEDGTILDPGGIDLGPLSIDYGWNLYLDISVTFDGQNYLIVFPEFVSGSWDIYGIKVATDGNVVGSSFPISAAVENQYYPHVTSSDNGSFVSWVDLRNSQNDIFGARIDTSGNVIDPDGIQICTNGGEQTIPNVAFDGHSYVTTWVDWRDDNPDIYGNVIELDGSVSDTEGFILQSDLYFQEYPTIQGGSNGKSLVSFSGYESETFFSSRVWGGIYTNPVVGVNEIQTQSNTLTNYPNPFSVNTKIKFELSKYSSVYIEICDITGRSISTLHDGKLPAGFHTFEWNSCDVQGNSLDSGVYLCHVKTDEMDQSLKILLIR